MSKKKIVIADDEQDVRRLVSSMLGEEYIVLHATNGQEAIDAARSNKPDLILMDVMMPMVDGYTACHVIKTDRKTKVIPVVMLTGLGHNLNKKLGTQLGADGYITKPFSSKDLQGEIGQFLRTKKAK